MTFGVKTVLLPYADSVPESGSVRDLTGIIFVTCIELPRVVDYHCLVSVPQAAHSADRTSACSNTVRVAFSRLSGG